MSLLRSVFTFIKLYYSRIKFDFFRRRKGPSYVLQFNILFLIAVYLIGKCVDRDILGNTELNDDKYLGHDVQKKIYNFGRESRYKIQEAEVEYNDLLNLIISDQLRLMKIKIKDATEDRKYGPYTYFLHFYTDVTSSPAFKERCIDYVEKYINDHPNDDYRQILMGCHFDTMMRIESIMSELLEMYASTAELLDKQSETSKS